MGWSMQPQAHVQFACRALDFGQSPSTILDAPRWRIAAEEQAILLEPGLESVAADLQARGHTIVATEKMLAASTPFGSHLMFGGAGYLEATPEGYAAAADPRRDGAAVGV
jgi:gamma-glutamyltranspeptidase/glutathione hydrolase